MPIIYADFKPSFLLKNPHFNTIYRPLFAKDAIKYQRKRITTWDNDFIDLDFSINSENSQNSKTLVLLIHGLEGSSNSNYIITTSNHLNKVGFDTVSMNLRNCSGANNLLLETYHSGKTDDVHFITEYLATNYTYENMIIVGFSLGGNLTLKYLGEYENISPKIKGGIAVSTPIDLTSSQAELSKFKNRLYLKEFLRTLKPKILAKSNQFPDFKLDRKKVENATRLWQLEAQYTAPIFGFKNPQDYWKKASSKPYIKNITLPTLLINSLDDPFLSEECYPFKDAKKMTNFYLLTPKYGGHVGFISSFNTSKNSKNIKNKWLEESILKFIQDKIGVYF
ncbi:alpha/beta fold hydrolase [Tenacibaculum dicentrarchi]|nr:alpha/beta fold hydrolase [Tenacibaculum dicentrarchi]MCD8419828.1 alpha/beta fold hydrolase [Tenacibaculum dicentrarchi]MCD8437162.1 alpha/beta fold hydrolase [Tenacibaculum dicentrarchi]MCG8827682.1 alpha/beta fold hydrolase [Tenacibaculum dicentrarchi]WBX69625.1 alpha/beta fold hydrolase [Tenacibaculum dicentrarchi]